MVCIWVVHSGMGCISDTSDLIMVLLLFALHSNCSIFLPFCIVRQRFHILLPLYLCICNWKRWSVFVKTLENIVSRTPSVPFSINFNAQCVSYRYIRRQFQNLSPSYCIRVRHWLRLQFHWDVADRISTFFLPSSIHSSIHSLLACCLQFRSLFNLFFRGPNKGAQNSGRIEQKRTDSRRLCCCCRTQESERKCTKTNINARILEKKCKRRGNNINPAKKPKQKKHTYTCIIDISFISALFLAFVLWHFVYVFLFAASHFILPVKIILVALYPFFTRSRSRPLLPLLLLLLLLVLRCEPKLIRISLAPINTCRFSLVLSLPLYRLFFHVWGQCWAQFFMRFIFMPFQSPLCV